METDQIRILVIEDEKPIADILEYGFRKEHFQVRSAYTGVDGLKAAADFDPHLVILDWMLPDLSGVDVCRMLTEQYNIPIVMLTAKSDESDKLKGYEYGADDYMTKPFSPKVLLAKVNALLRRTFSEPADALNAGDITVVSSSRQVYVEGEEIALTHMEYELLHLFMTNPGQVFTREQLLNRIWGYEFEGTSRTVDTHIKTLRQKLGSEGRHIVTLIRSGYKFER